MIQTEMAVPIELCSSRRASEVPYVQGSQSDGRKLGIAVESGGGAGPVSLAMLEHLHNIGALQTADALYGVSIGTVNSLAAVISEFRKAEAGYLAMTTGGFVKKTRPHRFMDMRILEKVMKGDGTGLDVDAISKFPIPINLGITRLSGGISPVVFDLTQLEPDNIIDPTIWGASIPGIAGLPPKDKRGILGDKNVVYADGGFSILSPVDMAANDDCTDIIYLSNHPYVSGGDERQDWYVYLFGSLMTFYDHRAIGKFGDIVDKQVETRRDFRDGAFSYRGINAVGYYPPSDPKKADLLPKLFNMNPERIKTGLEITKAHMMTRLPDISLEWVTTPLVE